MIETQNIEFKQRWRDDFHKAGFVESWGRGIGKVCKAFNQAKLPSPTFENLWGGTLVIIPRSIPDGKTASAEKSAEKILSAVADNPKITTEELSSLIGISTSGVEKSIRQLKKQG